MSVNVFGFDDSLEAKRFERDIKNVLHMFTLTTLGHIKEHYGIKPLDIDYCHYVTYKPRFQAHTSAKTYFSYAETHVRESEKQPQFYVIIKDDFRQVDNFGKDQYPDYDEKTGKRVRTDTIVADLDGTQILAAAVLERICADMDDGYLQDWWKSDWCRDLINNGDIDPEVVRNQVNANRKKYNSWKVPDEGASDDPRGRNQSVVRRSNLRDDGEYEYPHQHEHVVL